MGRAERHAAPDEDVGQRGRRRVALLGRGAHPHAVHGERLDEPGHDGEGRLERRDRAEQRRLVLLEVALVGQRQALEQRQHRRDRADHRGRPAADELGRVGVLLVGHHRRAGRERVGDPDEPEPRVRPPGHLLRQPAEVHHRQGRRGQQLDDEVAVGDGVERVRRDAVEAELRGRGLAVERVAGAGERPGARAARRSGGRARPRAGRGRARASRRRRAGGGRTAPAGPAGCAWSRAGPRRRRAPPARPAPARGRRSRRRGGPPRGGTTAAGPWRPGRCATGRCGACRRPRPPSR